MAEQYAVVIAFGVCSDDPDRLHRFALPGIRRCSPSAPISVIRGAKSIHRAYNEILLHFRNRSDLEALVLLHDDAEIVDLEFESRIRTCLASDRIGIVGPIGARGVKSLDWWRYEVFGEVSETVRRIEGVAGNHNVDCVDGLLMVLSPLAVATMSFDERYPGFHGYDADFCFQARSIGLKVLVTELGVVHHAKRSFGDEQAWIRANRRFQLKWRTVDRRAAWMAWTAGEARHARKVIASTIRRIES